MEPENGGTPGRGDAELEKSSIFSFGTVVTPWKINMEPENDPNEKENHVNQTFIFRFLPLIFRGGCITGIPPFRC